MAKKALSGGKRTLEVDWYQYPQYFDLAFRDETRLEADFFEAAFAKYAAGKVRNIFEPGCGGGRLVVEMARRGYHVTALDLSAPAVKYVNRRLVRGGLEADVFVGDMRQFTLAAPVDAAFNTFNTFRHLLTEQDARQHLQCVAKHVRPGGIYILGLHLLPADVDLESCERWTARHGQLKLNCTLRVVAADRRKRIERLRVSLRARSPRQELRVRHEFEFRMYTAAQLRRLLRSVSQWDIAAVFDFWYDIDDPLRLDDWITDTVLVLKRGG
jgi:SAM-dependent methyltransferase